MSKTEDEQRAEFVTGLRAVADWLEQNAAAVPLPNQANQESTYSKVRLSIGVHSYRDGELIEDVAAAFADAVKALGGTRAKDADDDFMTVTREFAPGIEVDVWAGREDVCEAVVVGTEPVLVEKVITPAVTETVVEERQVIEWRCAPVLRAVS